MTSDDLQRPFPVHIIILQYEVIKYELDITIAEAGFRRKKLNILHLKETAATLLHSQELVF